MTRYMILAALQIAISTTALSQINYGGYTFETDAFVDEVVGLGNNTGHVLLDVDGNFTNVIYGLSPEELTPGIVDTNDPRLIGEENAALETRFTDNSVVNGVGSDLVLFSTDDDQSHYYVQIGQVFREYHGTSVGSNLWAVEIDLSDFDIADDDFITDVNIFFYGSGDIVGYDDEGEAIYLKTHGVLSSMAALNSGPRQDAPFSASGLAFLLAGCTFLARRRS